MKFVIEAPDLIHAAAHPGFVRRSFWAKDDANYPGKQSGVMDPLARPELRIAANHLGFQILHAAEINEADRAVVIEQIVARMRIGVQRLDAEELEEKQARERRAQPVANLLRGIGFKKILK